MGEKELLQISNGDCWNIGCLECPLHKECCDSELRIQVRNGGKVPKELVDLAKEKYKQTILIDKILLED